MFQLTDVFVCMLVITFQHQASPDPVKYSAPYGVAFVVVPYFPPLTTNTELGFVINAVTLYRNCTVHALLFSNKRRFSSTYAYTLEKREGDNVYTFVDKLPIAPSKDELIVYYLFSEMSPFTATLIRYLTGSGALVQALALRPRVFRDSKYALYLESYKWYKLIFYASSTFTVKVEDPSPKWKWIDYRLTGVQIFVRILQLKREQAKPFKFRLSSSKPTHLLLYDPSKKTVVNVLSRPTGNTEFWLAVPWVDGTSYRLTVFGFEVYEYAYFRVDSNSKLQRDKKLFGVSQLTKELTIEMGKDKVHDETLLVQVRPYQKTKLLMVQMSIEDSKGKSVIRMDSLKTHQRKDVTYKFSLMHNGIQHRGTGFVIADSSTESLVKVSEFKFDSKPLRAMVSGLVRVGVIKSKKGLTAFWFDLTSTKEPDHVLEAKLGGGLQTNFYFYVFIGDAMGGACLLKYPYSDHSYTLDRCYRSRPRMGDLKDNDCDRQVDEEVRNLLDDDGDGSIDEDLTIPEPVDGKWGEWSSWTCAVTDCLAEGIFQRKRFCDEPIPEFGGVPCSGDSVEENKKCNGNDMKCYLDCPNGTYGWGCTNRCPDTCLNNKCDKQYGNCLACVSGYLKSPKCNKECHIENYGDRCSRLCPLECQYYCNFYTGKCIPTTGLRFLRSPTLIIVTVIFPIAFALLVFLLSLFWRWKTLGDSSASQNPKIPHYAAKNPEEDELELELEYEYEEETYELEEEEDEYDFPLDPNYVKTQKLSTAV